MKRGEIKTLVEIITGQNNLNYMNNKVYGSEDLCRFCEEEEETFDPLVNTCPCFHLGRVDLFQNQPIEKTQNWEHKTLWKFANLETIKDALSFDSNNNNYVW